MSKERFITVVYKFTDAEKSDPYRTAMCESLATEEEIPGTGLIVTGLSVEDEMSRVEYLEGLLDGEGIEY